MEYKQRIRDLREDRDQTQEQIAKILNTSQKVYSRYEIGYTPMPVKHIITLCRYYNVSADYILGFTDTYTSLPKR